MKTCPVFVFSVLGMILCGKSQSAYARPMYSLMFSVYKAHAQLTTVTLFDVLAPTPSPIFLPNSMSFSVLGTDSEGATTYLEVVAESLMLIPQEAASTTEFTTVSPTDLVCKSLYICF